MPKITTSPDNVEFIVGAKENILAAGLAQKLNLPHSCKNGKCSSCKCKVLSGEVKLEEYNHLILTDDEIKQGYTLLCKAHAVTDVVLDLPNLLSGFLIKIMPAKVESINKINNTAVLILKLPATQQFDFNAGQYVDIILQGKNRSYSLANAPHKNGSIELHIKYHAGGVFSEMVWNTLAIGSILRFKGPLGSFALQKTNAPIVMVCTGTGFAPLKAILEAMYENNSERQIHLYWGNRTVNDFYLLELVKGWQQKLNLTVKLCLSQESHAGYINGRVTDALLTDFNDLSNYEVYVCGNMQMIEDVYEMTTQKLKLLKNNFFSDAFTPSV